MARAEVNQGTALPAMRKRARRDAEKRAERNARRRQTRHGERGREEQSPKRSLRPTKRDVANLVEEYGDIMDRLVGNK
ncbi:MAG: hypothetical protein AAF485_21755, partial [Chloroflexota bacterium]